jgi:hypothetical protein
VSDGVNILFHFNIILVVYFQGKNNSIHLKVKFISFFKNPDFFEFSLFFPRQIQAIPVYLNYLLSVRNEVLTEVLLKIVNFWDAKPCRIAGSY